MTRFRVLITDGASRFNAGEFGTELLNDSDKYDRKIELDNRPSPPELEWLSGPRVFYFYANEVEEVHDN